MVATTTEIDPGIADAELVIHMLQENRLRAPIVGRGTAYAPRLAAYVIIGLALFKGAQVDPRELTSQPVYAVAVPLEGHTWHFVLTEAEHRVIAASPSGMEDVALQLAKTVIHVEWMQ